MTTSPKKYPPPAADAEQAMNRILSLLEEARAIASALPQRTDSTGEPYPAVEFFATVGMRTEQRFKGQTKQVLRRDVLPTILRIANT